jgi:putative dimethyl sulfoxide reductase chaperone
VAWSCLHCELGNGLSHSAIRREFVCHARYHPGNGHHHKGDIRRRCAIYLSPVSWTCPCDSFPRPNHMATADVEVVGAILEVTQIDIGGDQGSDWMEVGINFHDAYREELCDVLRNRQLIYELLRQLTGRPPHKNMLSQLCFLRNLADHSEGAKLICSFLQSCESDSVDAIMQETKLEYNRLFVGPDILPAPPWESVYVDSEHLLFGEVTLQVREIYREFGLQFIHGNHEPGDHIALELEFLSHLIKMTLSAFCLGKSKLIIGLLDRQILFLTDHILKWTPQFGSLLFENTTHPLYRGAARLLLEYLPCDLEIAVAVRGDLRNE